MVVISIDSLISIDARSFNFLSDLTFAMVVFFDEGNEFNDIQHIKDALLMPMNWFCVD